MSSSQKPVEQTEGGEQVQAVIERFKADNAPMIGIVRGNGHMGMAVEEMPDGSGSSRLHKMRRDGLLPEERPGDSYEETLLAMLAEIGVAPHMLGNPEELEEHRGDLERIAAKFEKIPGMEFGATALNALAGELTVKLKARQDQAVSEASLETLNDFLNRGDTKFWVSVSADAYPTPEDALRTDGKSAAYEHRLAQLVRLEQSDEGRARFVLRGADDTLGYRDGTVELYR